MQHILEQQEVAHPLRYNNIYLNLAQVHVFSPAFKKSYLSSEVALGNFILCLLNHVGVFYTIHVLSSSLCSKDTQNSCASTNINNHLVFTCFVDTLLVNIHSNFVVQHLFMYFVSFIRSKIQIIVINGLLYLKSSTFFAFLLFFFHLATTRFAITCKISIIN